MSNFDGVDLTNNGISYRCENFLVNSTKLEHKSQFLENTLLVSMTSMWPNNIKLLKV